MTSAGPLSAESSLHGMRLSPRTTPMILMYHGIACVADDPNQLCVSPDRFAAQMTWLARRGLRGVSVGTLVDAIHAGKQRGLVGITFDDGYDNVLSTAAPELQRHGFGATAFIISDRLGGTNEWDDGPAWRLLDGDQVRELASAGIEIGSHGATHVRLAGLDDDTLTAEIATSRANLSALLGTTIRGFAYPYGSMDSNARAAVGRAGYEYACAVEAPMQDIGILALPRVYVGQRDGAAKFATKRLLHSAYIVAKGMRR